MISRFLSAALVIAAALPALAAEDAPLPPLTPKGEYLVMTQDDATSTSKCIGNPATPMCAVETMLACRARVDFELCRIAWGEETGGYISKNASQRPTLYRVVRREVLDERHFPWSPRRDLPWRRGEPSVQAGDIRIDLLYGRCKEDMSPRSCRPFSTMAYIVRRQGDRWAVTEGRDPTKPPTPEDDYLVMTRDDATSSSKCIGNPVTPMCAVETLLACFVRDKEYLCHTAMGVAWDKVPDFSRDLPWPPIIYRVVRRGVLDDKHFPWRPTRDLDWRPGELSVQADDVRIDIVRRECSLGLTVPCVCEAPVRGPQGATAYIVRHEKGRWAVVTWGSVY